MDFSNFAEDIKKITYAGTYNKPLQNKVIRLMERRLVKSKIAQRFIELSQLITNGQEIEEATLKAFGLDVQITAGAVENVPKEGPVLVVGNHPFGIVDGMVVAAMLRRHRKDVKAVAHQGISNLPQFSEFFLPINFDQSLSAKKMNKRSIDEFKQHLADGGLGIIFPSGAVSTRLTIWKKNADPPWHLFVVMCAKDYNCKVVPVFIDGRCGPLFQLVSQFSMTLRLSSLLYENAKMIDSEIGLRIGEAIDLESLPADWDATRSVQFFRDKCYGLAGLYADGKPFKKSR